MRPGIPGNATMIRVGRTIARVAVVTCVFAVACLPALTLMGMASFSLALAAEVPEVVFDLSITAGAVPAAQRTIRVQKDDMVRWRVSSDAPGNLHLHAYRIDVGVAPGKPAEVAFKAYASGRFRVEWHAATSKPAAGAGHHAAPLASFEVRPR